MCLGVPADSGNGQPTVSAGARQGATRASWTGDSVTALIVDDNALFRDCAVEYLSRDPAFKVQGAGDGHEALRIMALLQPDIVILDLRMQGLDGFDVCRLIRKSAGEKRIHVVILTGFASDEIVESAKSCGADLCLAKPIELADLRRAMMMLARGDDQDGGSGQPAELA